MTAPDIVYLCRPGQNEELRFSLRSLHNLPHRRVFIFGDAPPWVNRKTTTVIPTPRVGGKFTITQTSLRNACNHTQVNDGFYLFNDDFYITTPIPRVPLLNRGRILDVIADYQTRDINSSYVEGMKSAHDLLVTLGHENPKSFELHVPMPIRKELMLQALDMKNTERFHWRTVYGNLATQRSKKINDVKVYSRTDPLPEGPYLSTNDTSSRYFRQHLLNLFPTPSPHER